MAQLETLFATRVYRARLGGRNSVRLLADLRATCLAVAAEDTAGQRWSRENAYPGYTSYASLNDLPWRMPAFADLQRHLDAHVKRFAQALELDLGERPLVLDSLWINVLEPGGSHAAHIHPNSVVSGTCYVAVPKGASAIRFEDPRLGQMMAAPPRRPDARPENRAFVSIVPQPGTVLLWESWLRHDVPVNRARQRRISVSFNYRWE
ncbi:MAG: hypothetical protein KDJ41_01520 [Hyphomicrobiaceae bacterium]|nr:hypothetical protein [Hyphomicrobiaceae bacterium]